MVEAAAPRFGVIVPCRNEAAVIARRIRNLARLDWPPAAGPHRVLVVDDGSNDVTSERAEAAIAAVGQLEHAAFELLVSPGPHGKAHAIALALDHLGDSVDLILLTDADVVFREGVPQALATAFGRPELGMASGAQEFVEDLADDGRCRGEAGGEPEPAPDPYDRWTAWVRALESRGGRLFSVHGQCLCWRAELGLRPTPEFAADDLDLMLQVRARGLRVELVGGARFLEPKVRWRPTREKQALRRAEAYFQLVRRTAQPLSGGVVDRLQWVAYRYLPGLAPVGVFVLAMVVLGVAQGVAGGADRSSLGSALIEAAGFALVIGLFLSTQRTLRWILRASRSERRRGLTDSWETARG